MDIRDWPMDRIMQLPDEAFGTRFSVLFSGVVPSLSTRFFISSIGLPNKCVLWEIFVGAHPDSGSGANPVMTYGLGLGDQLVTDNVEMGRLENILTGIHESEFTISIFRQNLNLSRLRIPVIAQGRRVVLAARSRSVVQNDFVVGLVFSAIPNEIPDFYKGPPTEQLDEIIRLLKVGVDFDRSK